MPEEDGREAVREALVEVSAALGTRDRGRVEAALRRAAPLAEPRWVDEVLLQAHLFIGFPDALEAFVLWRSLSPAVPAAAEEDADLWRERGERVCEMVYGRNYNKLRRNVAALHPDLDRWMVEGGYGRVIGREGLDLGTRESCIVALLAVWGAPRQLHSHLRGALNAGATASQVERALAIAGRYQDPESAARARELWTTIVNPG